MRINFSGHSSILGLAAVALLGLCVVQLPSRIVKAGTNVPAHKANQNDDGVVILSSSIPLGMGRGQTIRFTLFNPPSPRREPLRANVKLYDQRGNVIAESAETTIPPGGFRFFDFNRSDIPLAGEQTTGRVQVRGTITVFEQRNANGEIRTDFPTAIELMESRTGIGQSITVATGAYSPILIQ